MAKRKEAERAPGNELHRVSSVKVGPYDYDISWADRPPNDHIHAQRNWGLSDHSALVISVDAHAPRPILVETTLHEIIHAINLVYGVDSMLEMNISDSDKRAVEEFITNHIAMGLTQVLKDNPELLRAITAELAK